MMKDRPFRMRRIAKRAGLISCFLILLMWIVSMFRCVSFQSETSAHRYFVMAGLLTFSAYHGTPEAMKEFERQYANPDGWSLTHHAYHGHAPGTPSLADRLLCGFRNGPSIQNGLVGLYANPLQVPQKRSINMGCWMLTVPSWVPLLAIAIPTAFLVWTERRKRISPGHCQNCGYNLTGNVSGVCPECGNKK